MRPEDVITTTIVDLDHPPTFAANVHKLEDGTTRILVTRSDRDPHHGISFETKLEVFTPEHVDQIAALARYHFADKMLPDPWEVLRNTIDETSRPTIAKALEGSITVEGRLRGLAATCDVGDWIDFGHYGIGDGQPINRGEKIFTATKNPAGEGHVWMRTA